MTAFRCCAVVPTYDNPETIRSVVERIRVHLKDVLVVDDGSHEAGRAACASLEQDGLAHVLRSEVNRGKGAAVKQAIVEADKRGFTHVFQIDADGQHDLERIPDFVAAARENTRQSILAAPVYDASVPRIRLAGRQITRFWVDIEVGRGVIQDAMIGFRIYPLSEVRSLPVRADRMAFDVEIAVLMAWSGTPIRNLPVGVRYLTEAEGGRSHFRPFVDNLRLSWMHCRLCTMASIRWCLSFLTRPASPMRS